MKILALVGSPRKMDNTDLLVEQFLAGAKSRGCSTKKLYLYCVHINTWFLAPLPLF